MSLLVVLPFYFGDEHLLLKNLAWMKELDGRLDYDCMLACDTDTNPVRAKASAESLFRSVRVLQYKRVQHNHWPFQQNNAFTNVAWHISAKHNGPWFWCETDSVPTKKGWLDALWVEYQKGGKPFGGHWNPASNIFNGVAFYPQNIPRYSQDMMMAGLVDAKDAQGNPYQPPWDYYGSKQVRKHLHVMNGLMQHLWDFDGKPITFQTQESVQKLLRPEAVLFHRVKDGSLIDRLKERGSIDASHFPVVTSTTVHGKTPPKTEIFIVSFPKDLEWLRYSLRSIQKFACGFSGVTVAFPQQDSLIMGPVCKEFSAKRVMYKEDRSKGHLHHMVIKCMAERYCPDAEFIMHLDSDCLFSEEASPHDYFEDGKPVLLMESFERMKPVGDEATGMLWKAPTEKALGFPVTHEFMRRHPAVHPSWLYAKMRSHIEKTHGVTFSDYVLNQRDRFPYGFCEFCALGAYAWDRHRSDYHWIEVGKDAIPANKLTQFWSHGGMDWLNLSIGRRQGNVVHEIFNGKPAYEQVKILDNDIAVLKDDTHLSRWIEECGHIDHDPSIGKLIVPLLKAGDWAIDAGAALGDHAVPYARAVGQTGKVLAFEPNPDFAQCLRHNTRQFPWVTVAEGALGEQPGMVSLVRNPNVGASHVESGGVIPMVKLDSINLQRCDFLKADVEGWELPLMRGAAKMIGRCRPKMLLEMQAGHMSRLGLNYKMVFDYLAELKYRFAALDGGSLERQQYDLLCTPI